MSLIQIVIDDSTNKTVTGVYLFDRVNGGKLAIPHGSSFPDPAMADELFWRDDETKLYKRNSGNSAWEAPSGGSGITEAQHKALRQLTHFIDNGPAESFDTGAYREMTGTAFPTAIIWYDKASVGKKKIVEKTIAYTGAFPTTLTWKIYDASETLLATVTDTLSYSGAFETSRTRTIA